MPKVNATEEGSLEGVFKFIIDKIKQDIQKMLPCQVVSIDRTKNRVTVKPLIKVIMQNGTTQSRANNVNIPIFNLCAGNFIINFPVKIGDLGWIQANDRDISLFMQSYTENKPNTLRKHSLEDGVFFPDSMRGYAIADEDINNLVIQSFDNKTKITLSSNKIVLQAETIEQRATNHIFIGGKVTHDGVNIGNTHIHTGDDGGDTSPPKN